MGILSKLEQKIDNYANEKLAKECEKVAAGSKGGSGKGSKGGK